MDEDPAAAGQLSGRAWPILVRPARAADKAAVVAFTTDTWEGWDYLPRAFDAWLTARDGVLLVATVGRPHDGGPARDADGQPLNEGHVVGVARVALLSAREAWLEGIRVDPRVRGMSVGTDLQAVELRWAAAQAADLVRYATGERNEGSHRLGARHGFAQLVAFSTWRPTDASEDDDEDVSGFDAAVREAASRQRRELLARLAAAGLGVAPAEAAIWWSRLSGHALFRAAAGLYEQRSWSVQALTQAAFTEHAARGEVIALDDDDGWAVALLSATAFPAEDVTLHLATLVGDDAAMGRLASHIRSEAGAPVRLRLPRVPAADGAAACLTEAGFTRREFTLHILGRPLGGELPPLDPRGVIVAVEPSPRLAPPVLVG